MTNGKLHPGAVGAATGAMGYWDIGVSPNGTAEGEFPQEFSPEPLGFLPPSRSVMDLRALAWSLRNAMQIGGRQ